MFQKNLFRYAKNYNNKSLLLTLTKKIIMVFSFYLVLLRGRGLHSGSGLGGRSLPGFFAWFCISGSCFFIVPFPLQLFGFVHTFFAMFHHGFVKSLMFLFNHHFPQTELFFVQFFFHLIFINIFWLSSFNLHFFELLLHLFELFFFNFHFWPVIFSTFHILVFPTFLFLIFLLTFLRLFFLFKDFFFGIESKHFFFLRRNVVTHSALFRNKGR